MNIEKIGAIMKTLRLEKNMTQKMVAEQLGITEQAVSKWERGLGLPDVASLPQLADVLGIHLEAMLSGDVAQQEGVKIQMKTIHYYICPLCGNVVASKAPATIYCCDRALDEMESKKATEKLQVEVVEDEWFITTDHPMTKDDYIAFTAFATGERLDFVAHYPEWNLQRRIPKSQHGKLLWYSKKGGLQYQLL